MKFIVAFKSNRFLTGPNKSVQKYQHLKNEINHLLIIFKKLSLKKIKKPNFFGKWEPNFKILEGFNLIDVKLVQNSKMLSQPTITCSKLAIETLEKGAKYVQI